MRALPSAVLYSRRRRRSASGSQTVVTDTFTRADSAVSLGSADTGQAWSAGLGTWGIGTNKARLVTDSGSNNLATVESTKADCTISVTLSGTFAGGGILFRFVDTSNYLIAYADASNVTVYQNVATAFTLIGTTAYVWSANDVLSVVLSGQNIDARVNDVSKVTGTSAAHTTATKHGLFMAGGADPSARWDNFSVTVP